LAVSTILGIETDAGVVLAADRASIGSDGTVRGTVDRVFGFDAAGAAAVGDPGDVESFERRLQAELDRDRIERDRPVGVDRVARVASRIAAETGVEALVAARDGEGTARLRAVDADGAVLADAVAAFGSGAPLALGRLEGATFDEAEGPPEDRAREVLAAVAARDSETGEEADVWTLENGE
jgi:proteasome beta subunit